MHHSKKNNNNINSSKALSLRALLLFIERDKMEKIKLRSEIPDKYKWDLTKIFKNEEIGRAHV